jgi:hypothetical protein
MARLAKRPKIIFCVSPAAVKRTDVMHFVNGDVKSTFEAILAKRMLGDVQVSDFSPTPIVMAGVAMVSVILT